MIEIDGSRGEGGGQILRSALSLAACTGQAFRIVHIRAGRERPGLLRQHLTAVKAAATIADADVEGAEVGSTTVVFQPRTGFGEPGRSAESVAEQAAREVREYLAHFSPVGPYLADQLLLPMALGGLAAFRTCAPTSHFESNSEVIEAFTGKRPLVERDGEDYLVRASRLA